MRESTNELLELAEEGVISWETIARSCLCYLSEDDVADMARVNELLFEEEEDDESDESEEEEEEEDDEEYDIMDDYNYVGSHWHY